jgi:multidrug efflux pump subunit AcrA (membrane-fusion protein)
MIRQHNMIARPSRTLGVLLLAATALSVAACKRGEADAAPAKAETMLVGPENVTVVRAEQIRSGPAISGSLSPERSATIRAEMTGSVLQTYAEAGQRVRRGQALAQIDATVLRDQALSPGAFRALGRHHGAEHLRHRQARSGAQ